MSFFTEYFESTLSKYSVIHQEYKYTWQARC